MNAPSENSPSKRILITRSEEDCAVWSEALATYGAVAVALPCIATVVIDDDAIHGSLREALEESDWLVLTSRRGAEAVAMLAADALPATLRIAVVGAATGEAARSLFGRVDLVGKGGTAAALADSLIDELAEAQPQKLLLALAENAADTLESSLSGAGFSVRRIDVYTTLPSPEVADKKPFSSLNVDAVFLASPSAASGFCHQVEMDTAPVIVTIGPSTSDAARRLGLEVSAEAGQPSLEGLLEAMQCLT